MTVRHRATALLAVASIGLAACGASDDDAGSTTDAPPTAASEPASTEPPPTEPPATEPVPTEPPAAEPAPTEPPATDPPATDPPATAPAASGADPACLVGDWVITQDEMNAYYDAIEASLPDTPITIDITGQVLLTFTESEYRYTGDFDLAVTAVGQTGTGTSAGTVSGTWTVVDDKIQTTLVESDLDVTVTVGGITLSGSDLANGILNSVPIVDSPFDCAGPTIAFQVTTVDGPRHDITLTPA